MIGAVKSDDLSFAISEGFGKKGIEQRNSFEVKEKDKGKSFEILHCGGTISWEKDNKEKPRVHAHIMLAENDGNGNAFGGHLLKGTISIVGEIIIEVLST